MHSARVPTMCVRAFEGGGVFRVLWGGVFRVLWKAAVTATSVERVLVCVQVMLYCLKHQWSINPKMSVRLDIIDRATALINELSADKEKAQLDSGLNLPRFTIATSLIHISNTARSKASSARGPAAWGLASPEATPEALLPGDTAEAPMSVIKIADLTIANKPSLIAKAYFCLAQWKSQVAKELSQETADEINEVFDLATQRAPTWGKLWHKQGIFNMLVLREWIATNRRPLQDCTYIISTSVMAFFKSVTMHSSGSRHETLQVRLQCLGHQAFSFVLLPMMYICLLRNKLDKCRLWKALCDY